MSDPVNDLKRELVAAAERRQQPRAVRPARRRLAAGAALAVAATAALLSIAPLNSSPSFLAQAEAALTATDGVVLHQKWVATTTSAEFGCSITHRPSEVWIDQRPPHRYRVVMNDAPPPGALGADRRALACWNGEGTELGGLLDSGGTLEFAPPNRLRRARARFGYPVDLVADLRHALQAGIARDEGETTRDGRTVRRIRVEAQGREPTDWYVDPETFQPVGMDGPAEIDISGRRVLALRVVVRFLAYEELPRSADNVALTDIRAQHPDARMP